VQQNIVYGKNIKGGLLAVQLSINSGLVALSQEMPLVAGVSCNGEMAI